MFEFMIKKLSYCCNFIFSPRCVICGFKTQSWQLVCPHCQKRLPILPQHCQQCGIFLYQINNNLLCGECLKAPPPFEKTYILFPYFFPIPEMIKKLKFKHELLYAKAFADFFVQAIPLWYKDHHLPDILLPMPLHPARLKERGFNQAAEIASPITKKLKIELDLKNIKRIKHTVPQSELKADERAKNVLNAFDTFTSYEGKTVAILDDVMTTGHTIRSLATLLKKKSAKEIHTWCCARR